MSEQRITVVNIVAVSYSGSTWTALMLGAHSQGFCVGEIDWIVKTGQAVCTLHGPACPIWSRFDPKSEENPYLQIARLSGRRVLAVNNTRRMMDQQKHPQIDQRFLWVVRDGRAVVASTLRKYPDRSTWTATRQWKRAMLKKRRLIRQQPPANCLTVGYEQLAADTPGHLRKICEFIGVDYEPAMLDYAQLEQHPIGGNPGAMSVVAGAQHIEKLHNPLVDPIALSTKSDNVTAARNAKIDLNFYQRGGSGTIIDERWKKEMTDRQLRLFTIVAGGLNRRLGYPGLNAPQPADGPVAGLADFAAAVRGGEVLKADARSRVVRVQAPAGDRVIKLYPCSPATARLRRTMGVSIGQKEAHGAQRLAAIGLRVAVPMDAGLRQVNSQWAECLISENVPGVTLRKAIEDGVIEQPAALARRLGDQLGRMTAAGCVNRDAKANNLMIDEAARRGEAEPVIIDTLGVRRRRSDDQIIRMLAILLETCPADTPDRWKLRTLVAMAKADPSIAPSGVRELAGRVLAAHRAKTAGP